MSVDYKVIVIGAGVVGLAVARALAEQNVTSVLVIEKETDIGRGISSRNSEVIHSGIYYPTDSLKARYCALGRDKLYEFCRRNDVWHRKCGKLVVAQSGQEKDLEQLHHQAVLNEVPDICFIDKEEIVVLEPEVSAESVLFVGCTGILSVHELMSAFYRISADADHDLLLNARVVGVEPEGDRYAVVVYGPGEVTNKVTARWVVNSAGLESDRVAELLWGPVEGPSPRLTGGQADRSVKKDKPTLHYSKGSYFKLSSKWRHRIQHLVYPIPDEIHDFLGIHLSFDMAGDIRLGPDAEWLDERKEDYTVSEVDREKFYRAGKQYLPNLQLEDLTPDFAGIRPKLVRPGEGYSDFYIRHEEDLGYRGWVNLIGIDSPGLTAAIAIGEDVAGWISEE